LYVTADGWLERGKQAMRQLCRVRPPTPSFCYNDLTAIGAIEAAHSAGLRVPEDLSVVGFDDICLARHTIPPHRGPTERRDGRTRSRMALALVEAARCRKTTLPGRLVVPFDGPAGEFVTPYGRSALHVDWMERRDDAWPAPRRGDGHCPGSGL
jgi:hypothetical protein